MFEFGCLDVFLGYYLDIVLVMEDFGKFGIFWVSFIIIDNVCFLISFVCYDNLVGWDFIFMINICIREVKVQGCFWEIFGFYVDLFVEVEDGYWVEIGDIWKFLQ